MFKQNHSSSGRPMNAPTVWFVQTIKILRSGIKVFDLKKLSSRFGCRGTRLLTFGGNSAIDFWRKLDYYLNCITLSMLIFRQMICEGVEKSAGSFDNFRYGCCCTAFSYACLCNNNCVSVLCRNAPSPPSRNSFDLTFEPCNGRDAPRAFLGKFNRQK